MGSDKTATYSLNLESNSGEVSKEAAAELEKLRDKLQQSTEFVKQMQGSLRGLRGASDEVKEAKQQLKAKIEAERGAIAQGTLAILKQGTTYDKLATQAKKAGTAQKEVSGPVKDLTDKISKLGESFATGAGRMNLMAIGGIALAAVLVDVAAKAAGAAVDVAKFAIVGADTARSMALQREAANGGAENAKNWGEQIDALARKVPTSIEKLNELSLSLSKSLSGGQSRASGQTIIDTFNAVGQASSAMGDEVGSTLASIIEEGKRFNRVGLDPTTLQGKWNTGWEDIAKSVAKNLNVSVATAKVALMQHRVTLDAGAKAIRDAVEARFGEINAKKLISLDSLSQKLHDDWINLTKGFSLEPILQGLKKVVDLFDVTAVEGYALKELFTGLGQDLGANVDDGVSIAKTAVDEFIIALQELELWVLHNKAAWKQAFEDSGGIEGVKKDVEDVKDVVVDLAKALKLAADAFMALKNAGGWVSQHLGQEIGSKVFKVQDWIANNEAQRTARTADIGARNAPAAGAGGVGKDMGAGIAQGVKGGSPDVNRAMVDAVKGGIAAARGPGGADAHSPSRKAEALGRDIAAGTAQGIGSGQPAVDSSMASMATPAPAARSGGGASAPAVGAGGGTVINVTVEIHVDGSKGAGETAKQLSAPEFLSGLTKAIRQALVTQGVPTQGAPPPS